MQPTRATEARYPPRVSSIAARLAGSASALGLGAAVGLGLGLGHDHYGASPLALGASVALVCAGIGLSRAFAPSSPRLSKAAAWAGLALLLAADHLGSAPAVALALLVFGACAGLSGRALRSPALAVLGGVGLVAGFTVPLLGFGLPLVAWTLLDLRPDEDLDRPALRAGALVPALVAGGGAFLVFGSWTAARGALDPTAAGLLATLAAGSLGATLASLLPYGDRRWPDPLALGAAALLVLAVVAALPHRSAVHVLPLAGAEDPRLAIALLMSLVGVPGGLVLGVAARRVHDAGASQTLAWLSIAGGALLGVHAGPGFRDQALGLACLAGLALVLVARQWLAKAAGPLVWAGAAAVVLAPLPWPEQELLHSRAYQLRTTDAPQVEADVRGRLAVAAGGWGPAGTVAVETRGDRLDRLVVDGFVTAPTGRAENAARMAGHLGPALSAASTSALVLGDTLGSATPGLVLQGVETITVAVPDPAGLRALDAVDPERTAPFLHPSVRLVAGPGERVLEQADSVDVLVEIVHTPWRDAVQGLPGRRGLERRHDALSSGGVYLLVVPLSWMTAAELEATLGAFTEAFPEARAFRPPDGADQLLLAGWSEAGVASWDRVVQATTLGLEELLLLDIRSPLALADRALVGHAGLAALGEGAPTHRAWHLGSALHQRPQLHITLLKGRVEGGDWLLGLDEDTAEELELRAETNRCWIEVLESASTGDYPSIFEGGRCLDRRNLDPLVEPHLERARAALEQATLEGPGSLRWRDCIAHVSTVTLLHPTSAEAWAISGRCRMVVDRTHAKEDFERALEYDAMHLDALLGLSQAQVKGGELAAAETTLRKATQYHNLEWRPHYYLGALLMDLGRYDEAEDELARAKTYAKDQSSLPMSALAHVYLLQGRPNDAIFWAEAAVDREATARNLDMLGRTWLELDQLQAAERNFRKAILEDPNYWPAHAGLGRARARQGDYADAIASFERVLEFEPRNPDALAALEQARVLAEQQQEP